MKFMPTRIALYYFFICVFHNSYLKVESEVTVKELTEVSSNVLKASKMLEYASQSLRSAYINTDVHVDSFVKLRRSVTNEAKVYGNKILPIATALIQRLQEFSEDYDVISFDEFQEYLDELTKEAEENFKFSTYVLELHKAILTEFKKLDGQAKIVLNELELEAKYYEEKVNKFRREAKVKDNLAIGLIWIPLVNLIAIPILNNEREDIIAQSIAAEKQREFAVAATKAIEGPLIRSIGEFISAIGGITSFFEILHQELKSFSGRHEKFKRSESKRHFSAIKKKVKELIFACRFFMSKIPEFETNLLAIPNDHDQNYVQEWLSKKQVEIWGEKKTFTEWGKNWFGSNKQITNLLGLPATSDRNEL
ncbi:hypothetical protein Glove_120g141 [Diversispora epigaea]|uniref:Uncharacterized protein n=1 Tax=Diversispora epigaea TaxID=1348612 RepID=A0A397J3E7_9GLOM|nr:hypothetical protein Glove_120g141 [Diversispora epigaea]